MCFIQVQNKIDELHNQQSTRAVTGEHQELSMPMPAYETSYGQNWRRDDKQINEVEPMKYVEQASTLIENIFHSIQMHDKVDPKLQDKINQRLLNQLRLA